MKPLSGKASPDAGPGLDNLDQSSAPPSSAAPQSMLPNNIVRSSKRVEDAVAAAAEYRSMLVARSQRNRPSSDIGLAQHSDNPNHSTLPDKEGDLPSQPIRPQESDQRERKGESDLTGLQWLLDQGSVRTMLHGGWQSHHTSELDRLIESLAESLAN